VAADKMADVVPDVGANAAVEATVDAEPQAGADAAADSSAGLSMADRLMYQHNSAHGGISDAKQLSFFSRTQHTAYEAISKLNINVAPYGASLHDGVRRLIVLTNPEEALTHRWIRVLDRIGSVADGDEHAERIINIGLSFDYGHLEMDALTGTNAALLEKRILSTLLGSCFHSGGEDNAADGAVPKGGHAIARGGVYFPAPSEDSRDDGADMANAPAAALDGTAPVSDGGIFILRNARGGSSRKDVSSRGGDRTKVFEDPDKEIDNDPGRDQSRTYLILKRPPTVKSAAPAVDVVESVSLAIGDLEDALAVLRLLLRDSVLRLAHTAPDAVSAGVP